MLYIFNKRIAAEKPIHLAKMPQVRGTAVQNILFDLSDEIRRQLEVPGFVESVDATSYLILKTSELLAQAELASLLPSSEAKSHANKVMRFEMLLSGLAANNPSNSVTNGIRTLQENAPNDGTTSQEVADVNRDIKKVLLTICVRTNVIYQFSIVNY